MKRQQKTLLITALIFATPVLLAVIVYMNPGLIELGTKNHGTLVTPARPLDSFSVDLDGRSKDKTLLEGKWSWTTFIDGPCGEVCAEQLYKSRQVRLALGKDIDRGQRLLVQVGTPAPLDDELLKSHPDLIVATTPAEAPWLQAFRLNGADLDMDNLYLVDPLGNLMMLYPPSVEGPKILKDIQRLVKVSWIKPK